MRCSSDSGSGSNRASSCRQQDAIGRSSRNSRAQSTHAAVLLGSNKLKQLRCLAAAQHEVCNLKHVSELCRLSTQVVPGTCACVLVGDRGCAERAGLWGRASPPSAALSWGAGGAAAACWGCCPSRPDPAAGWCWGAGTSPPLPAGAGLGLGDGTCWGCCGACRRHRDCWSVPRHLKQLAGSQDEPN